MLEECSPLWLLSLKRKSHLQTVCMCVVAMGSGGYWSQLRATEGDLERLLCYALVSAFVHMCLCVLYAQCVHVFVLTHRDEIFWVSICNVNVNIYLAACAYVCHFTFTHLCIHMFLHMHTQHLTLFGHQSKSRIQCKGLKLNKWNHARDFNVNIWRTDVFEVV